jgi:hypothetical protein
MISKLLTNETLPDILIGNSTQVRIISTTQGERIESVVPPEYYTSDGFVDITKYFRDITQEDLENDTIRFFLNGVESITNDTQAEIIDFSTTGKEINLLFNSQESKNDFISKVAVKFTNKQNANQSVIYFNSFDFTSVIENVLIGNDLNVYIRLENPYGEVESGVTFEIYESKFTTEELTVSYRPFTPTESTLKLTGFRTDAKGISNLSPQNRTVNKVYGDVKNKWVKLKQSDVFKNVYSSLKTDYGSFSNHVRFGSAKAKLLNAFKKFQKIQTLGEEIGIQYWNQENIAWSLLSDNWQEEFENFRGAFFDLNIGSKTNYTNFSSIIQTFRTFTEYERYLFMFQFVRLDFVDFTEYVEQQLTIAEDFDAQSEEFLFYHVPELILENDKQGILSNILLIYGEMYDQIWVDIKAKNNEMNFDYSAFDSVPRESLNFLLKEYGLEADIDFSEQDIELYFGGTKNVNMLKSSEQIGNSDWFKTTGVNVLLNADESPRGDQTASIITFSQEDQQFLLQTANVIQNVEHTFSVYIKLTDLQSAPSGSLILLNNDQEQDISAQVSDTWKRFEISGTPNSNGQIVVYFSGNGGDNIRFSFFGAQLEENSMATAYQKTDSNSTYLRFDSSRPLQDLSEITARRMLYSLTNLYKMKGTKEVIHYILNVFGIPRGVFNVVEMGYVENMTLQNSSVVNEYEDYGWYLKKDFQTNLLVNISDSDLDTTNNTFEFIFKGFTNNSGSILEFDSNNKITLEDEGTYTKNLKVYESGSLIFQSNEIDLNGDLWTYVSINRENTSTGSVYISQKFYENAKQINTYTGSFTYSHSVQPFSNLQLFPNQDISITEFRVWDTALSIKENELHGDSFTSIAEPDPLNPQLLTRFSFDNQNNTTFPSVDGNYTISTTNFDLSSYFIEPFQNKNRFNALPALNFGSDNVLIDQQIPLANGLSSKRYVDDSSIGKIYNYETVGVLLSPSDKYDRKIIDLIGDYVDLVPDDLDYETYSTVETQNLDTVKRRVPERLRNIKLFINLYKLFNNKVLNVIQEFTRASSEFVSGIVIKNNVLNVSRERKNKSNLTIIKNYEGNIDLGVGDIVESVYSNPEVNIKSTATKVLPQSPYSILNKQFLLIPKKGRNVYLKEIKTKQYKQSPWAKLVLSAPKGVRLLGEEAIPIPDSGKRIEVT